MPWKRRRGLHRSRHSQLLESADEGAAKEPLHPEPRDANLRMQEVLQREVRLLQVQYEGAEEDLQSIEISLTKLSGQCEELSREKENFERIIITSEGRLRSCPRTGSFSKRM